MIIIIGIRCGSILLLNSGASIAATPGRANSNLFGFKMKMPVDE